jgi:hypothetical protein
MTSRPATQPSAPAGASETHRCDACRKPLKRVRYELYSDQFDRDDVERRWPGGPVRITPSTYVGTYGGACYYRVRTRRASLMQPSYRRVVRVEPR